MKKITKMILLGSAILLALFFFLDVIYLLFAGFLWLTDKVSVFLDKLHIARNLIDMFSISIVGSCLIVLVMALIYFLFFRGDSFYSEE